MKKIILVILVLTIMTSCKMYDWHYKYSGQEKRKITPELIDILKEEKQEENGTK